MKDYERLTEKGKPKYCEKLKSGIANWEAILRLSNLEDKIERGEIDYVADKDKEIARLTAENAALNAKLKKAIILPYEIGKTVYWSIESEEKSFIIQEGNIVSYSIDNTGIWIFCRYNSGLTYWHKIDDFIKNVDTDRAKAEARLAQLKGGDKQ